MGRTLIEDFRYCFNDIIAISKSYREQSVSKTYKLDITDPNFIDTIVENSPSAIIHTAARSIVRDCELNPAAAFNVNVQGTVNVLEAVRKLRTNIPVIVLETDKVYGQQSIENIPTNENASLLGWSPYEYSKVLAANVCDFYRDYYGLNVYSLRPANLYGWHDNNLSRIVPKTISNLLSGVQATVYQESINQTREYVYIDDVCRIIIGIISHANKIPAGAYNISSKEVLTPVEVIETIARNIGIPTDTCIKIIEKDFVFKEIINQELDGKKLEEEFKKNGIELNFTKFNDGISKIISRRQDINSCYFLRSNS